MAQDLDDVLESTIDTETFDLEDNTASPAASQSNSAEDDLPEKYRGKSAKEIAAMHQEAEKLIGKQGSEVGELRKVVDDFIRAQTSKDLKTTETDVEISDEYVFVNPTDAINKMVGNHPAVKEAQQAAVQMKKAEVLSRLQSDFPNLVEIVNNTAFQEWVKGSKVRTELMIRAESQLDYDSAKELLDTWTERQSISKKVTETSKLDREQQLKAADVGSKGSTESASKKKYRRSDIIELMKTNPSKYNALAKDIMKAYEEGRVV